MEDLIYKFKVVLKPQKGDSFIVVHSCKTLTELHNYLAKEYPKCKTESILGG